MGDPALALEDASFAYVRGRPVLRGATLAARPGEVTMILGTSGSGKTTVLKLFKGLLAAQSGIVRVLGADPGGAGRQRLDPRVAYIPQQLGLVRSLSAVENALVGTLSRAGRISSLVRLGGVRESAKARELLTQLGIGHKADAPVHELSGGERQRVAIARALMQEPKVLLADEFISDLDPLTSAEIMEIIRRMAAGGVAVVMTTHEMDVVREHADHVIVLRNGAAVLDSREVPDPRAITEALR